MAAKCSPVIRVERPKYVLAELVGVALRKEAGVDFEKLVSRQLTIRTVSLQTHRHTRGILTLEAKVVNKWNL